VVTVLVWAGVVVLGGCGAVLRLLADGAVSARLGRSFPWGILIVNVSGAAALGLLGGLALDRTTTLLAGTALLGSYTTFSTWMADTHRLGEDRRVRASVLNVVVSLLAGVAAAELGHALGHALIVTS
jgi:CrcB protein